MSHNIEHFTYPENVDKRKVKKSLDEYVWHRDYMEGCTGLYSDIRWLGDKVYPNYDEAEKAIKAQDKGWYDQLAVKYYEPVAYPNDAKKEELDLAVRKAYDEYHKKDLAVYPKTLTSSMIGCKKCGSRLSVKHLYNNFCPVCKNDLRPEYLLKSIESAKARWNKAGEKVRVYLDKHSKKEVNWLVKIEYHT